MSGLQNDVAFVGRVKGQKENFLSVAKALGIILMVVGHAGCPDFLYRFIYMFHMPLFFFCSGYLFKRADGWDGLYRFMGKKVRGLYWPYVKWSLLFLLLHNLFYVWHLYDPHVVAKYSFEDFLDKFVHVLFTMTGHDKLLDPFWFMKQLFLSSIFVSILIFWQGRLHLKYKGLLTGLLLVLLSSICKYYDWGLPVVWDLSIVFLSSFFFYAGFLYRVNEMCLAWVMKWGWIWGFLVVLVVVVVYHDYLDMLFYSSTSVFLFVFGALAGIAMMFSISYQMECLPMGIKKILYYIGNHTMTVLALHLLAFKLGSLLKILVYGLPVERLADFKVIAEHNTYYWIVYTLIGCFVPLLYEYLASFIRRRLNNWRVNIN